MLYDDSPISGIIVSTLLLALQIRLEQLVDAVTLIREGSLTAVAEVKVRFSVKVSSGRIQSQLGALDDTCIPESARAVTWDCNRVPMNSPKTNVGSSPLVRV